MKKTLAWLLALCMLLTSAFAFAETATGTAKGFGGDVTVAISVENAAIVSAEINADKETPTIGGAAAETLEAAIVNAQGTDFDGVSGATVTSNAVKEALQHAMIEAGLAEATVSELVPGVYSATYRGYCSDVTTEVTITAEGIADVQVVSNDETVGIGSYAIERIPGAIIENQTAGVDAVSGATATSNAILAAVRDCLRAAGADMSVYNKAPEKEPARDEEYTTDVVVVGAGAAGFAAACRALQEGVSVIVVEKMDIPGGNTVRSSGVWNVKGPDEQEIEDFITYTMTGGHDLNDPELVRIMVTNSSKISPWLMELGFEVNVGEDGTPKGSVKGLARGLITTYWNKVEEMGGTVIYSTKAEEIMMQDGVAVGIKGTSKNGGTVTINAKAVILATGGFGYDLEKCYELKPSLTGMITNNSVGATGDGIYMAEAVGAQLIDMEQIQAHPTVEQSTATLITEGVRNAGGILLNAEGNRFCNENTYRDVVAGHILEQTGAYAYVVFNQDLYNSNGNIPTYDKLGIVAHCESFEDIAAYIGCDAEAVKATMEKWNAACEAQNDPEFESAFKWTRNIAAEGPWYVIKIAPGIHHTMGGIKINTTTQVISTEGTPIEGLYACGEVTGGVHGGNRVGGNALIDCQVFGIIAGETAAAYAK